MARVRHIGLVRNDHAVILGAGLAVVCIAVVPLSSNAHAAAVESPAPQAATKVPVFESSFKDGLAQVMGTKLEKETPAGPGQIAGAPLLLKKKDRPAITPSGWRLPVTRYSFSAVFGEPGGWASGYHTGLDFVTNEGRIVSSPRKGVVVEAAEEGAYGNLVRIRIAPKLELWFAHLENVLVTKGQKVDLAQPIGHVGMTGRTTGPHLHFEVRVNDKPQDPVPYFWPNGRAVQYPLPPEE